MTNNSMKSLKIQLSKALKFGNICNEHKETTLYYYTS